jgi:predicted molibdopterin-dependent oxidoreductase YjgC
MPYPISYRGLPVEQDDPFFDRDYNLCVLCGRCVRVCQEVRHSGVLAFINRGSEAIVGTAFGRSHLETGCQFCGACVDVCPTGALADKRAKWEGVPGAVVPSVCPYCSVGCAVNLEVKNGKVIRALGRAEGMANDGLGTPGDGQLCVRGRFGVVDVVHSLTRVKVPLVRRHGRLVEVSWDEALGVVAEQLGRFQADQFALVASAAATNETNYALQKFARVVMRSNNVALAAGFPEHGNGDGLVNTLTAIDGQLVGAVRNARCILTIGTNLFDSHPILGLEVRHALSKGACLISVDVRQTAMARQAEIWLQPKVGTDHVLLAGIVKALADLGLRAADSPDLSKLDWDRVSAVTGVKLEALVGAAQRLAEYLSSAAGDVVIIYGSGVTHHPTALSVIQAIHRLAALDGHVQVMGVPGEGNFVGSHDVGMHPAWLPGYRPLGDTQAAAAFGAAWGVAPDPAAGRNYAAILDGVRQGQIKALYLAGEMPALPELSKLEFLVVQDIVSTEVMQHAHVVLPATTFAEMDGTFTNLEGRVQRLHQAIQQVGLARPGWMIARDIARSMGHELGNYRSAADVMAEFAALVPAYRDMVYERLNGGGTLRRFDPTSVSSVEPAAGIQAASLDLDGVWQVANSEYPLTLITERNLFYYHGACLTEQVKGMNLIKQEEVLFLSAADADRLAVADGAVVKVVSPHGSMECVAQVTDEMMPEGAAFASFNRASSSPLFPTLTPNAKAYAIRVESE